MSLEILVVEKVKILRDKIEQSFRNSMGDDIVKDAHARVTLLENPQQALLKFEKGYVPRVVVTGQEFGKDVLTGLNFLKVVTEGFPDADKYLFTGIEDDAIIREAEQYKINYLLKNPENIEKLPYEICIGFV